MMRTRLAIAGAVLTLTSPAYADTQRFALAIMHFNIQYVEGGTYGLWPTPHTVWEKSDPDLQDLIVTQSLEPVIDLFAAHPTWGADIEMQGYMLDVLGQRHPDVLAKLKALATSGQIEVVSFHYSDQFFIAHAYDDWSHSADLTRQTFMTWGVPLSGSVFCQEGQAGGGMAGAMKDKGWSTLIFPVNEFTYQHGSSTTIAPLYQLGDVDMVTTSNVQYMDANNSIDVIWTFADDGEKLATNGLDPYVVPSFVTDPAAVATYASQLTQLEAGGYQVTTVGKYAAAVKALMTPTPAPPLLDGTWQPNSTESNLQWLGGFGLHGPDERDDDNHSLAVLAHREIEAATTIAQSSKLDATTDLAAAWRLLALGEGSDASGVNPIKGEVEYGLAYDAEALRIARDVIVRAKAAMNADTVGIDTQAATVTPGDQAPPAPKAATSGPLAVVAGGDADRTATLSWATVDTGHWVLSVTFGTSALAHESISLTVPGTLDDLVVTPALLNAPVHFHRSDFAFDTFELTLSDGLVSLGGNLWIIEDEAREHVAAQISATAGDVLFHDNTAAAAEQADWVFHVFQGDEASATALARSINVLPKVYR